MLQIDHESKINTIYINMEHEQVLSKHGMAKDGLKHICNNYLNFHRAEDNMEKFRTEIDELQNVQLGEKEQEFFFNINSAILVQWLIQLMNGQINVTLFVNKMQNDVIFTILRMVQTSRFAKAQTIVPKNTTHSKIAFDMLAKSHSQFSVWSDKITSERQLCPMISQNITTIKTLILAQRKQIRQNSSNLLNKITWIDLNSLFLNILLNLKRTIKKINDRVVNQNIITSQNIKILKTIQLYIHYLWATNFTRTQPFIKQIREVSNPERKKTVIYHLYDKKGAQKISRYIEQASFIQIKNDIEFIYQKIESTVQQ